MIETDAICPLLVSKYTKMGCWLNLIPWQKSDRRLLKTTLKGPYLESIPYLQIWYRLNPDPMYYTTSNTSLHMSSTEIYNAKTPRSVLNAFTLK